MHVSTYMEHVIFEMYSDIATTQRCRQLLGRFINNNKARSHILRVDIRKPLLDI
jgi:hypothetical protein